MALGSPSFVCCLYWLVDRRLFECGGFAQLELGIGVMRMILPPFLS